MYKICFMVASNKYIEYVETSITVFIEYFEC